MTIERTISASNPRVSIGLPVYNGVEFIEAALDSLLAQTFRDFELIISDNASTDMTESICLSYAARDRRIRYHRQDENRGSVWNFNHVFHLSCGEYFKWAAHDDICHPTFLARCVDVLDKNPSILWCHTRSAKIDQHGQKLPRNMTLADGSQFPTLSIDEGHPRQNHKSSHPYKRFQGVLLGTDWCVDCFGLYRASVLGQTRLELPCYGSEKVLIGEMSLRGCYQEIPETLFFNRVHHESSGTLNSGEQQNFVDPRRQYFAFTRLKLLWGHIGSIFRVNLSLKERAFCIFVILQYMLQVKKWGRIIKNTITGVGMRSRNLPISEAQDQETKESVTWS